MTYVEFFDKTSIENIASCLVNPPEKVVFIGDNAKLMKKRIANYEKVFAERGQKIEFFYKTVSKSNLDNAVAILEEIIAENEDCNFDITGGNEILNLALGMVWERNQQKNIQIHRINIRNNKVYDCDKDGQTIFEDIPKLTIQENIRIYGGDIVYGEIDDTKTFNWDMNPEFVKDIENIWNICKADVRYWNTQIGVLDDISTIGETSDDGLTVVVYRAALNAYLQGNKHRYVNAPEIIGPLLDLGLLTEFEETDDTITVSYKNKQIKKCLTVAGQALEMKILSTARALSDDDGTPLYNDTLSNVTIDWDGEFHDEKAEKVFDTENEIDVLLMHGIVPVFISCKNGVITADELYKLDTVAGRFGGQYAKRVIVATSLKKMKDKGVYIRQRAEDMNIRLIEDIQDMSDEELAKRIKNVWNT